MPFQHLLHPSIGFAMGSCIILRNSILIARNLARIRFLIALRPTTKVPHLRDRVQLMARQFSVLAVQAEGQKLSPPAIDRSDGNGLPDPPNIPEGSRLVAVVNNGEWQSALDVTYPSVYQKVYRRHQEGIWNTWRCFPTC
jgi:hypothetical protein